MITRIMITRIMITRIMSSRLHGNYGDLLTIGRQTGHAQLVIISHDHNLVKPRPWGWMPSLRYTAVLLNFLHVRAVSRRVERQLEVIDRRTDGFRVDLDILAFSDGIRD